MTPNAAHRRPESAAKSACDGPKCMRLLGLTRTLHFGKLNDHISDRRKDEEHEQHPSRLDNCAVQLQYPSHRCEFNSPSLLIVPLRRNVLFDLIAGVSEVIEDNNNLLKRHVTLRLSLKR